MSEIEIDLKSPLMDYVMPNPVFVMEQEKRSKYLHQIGDQLESISKLFNRFSEMGEKLCSTLADIFSIFREVGMISSDSKYSPLMASFKSTTLALRSHFLGINESVVDPLQEFVKKDLKTLKEYRKQYEHCSAAYGAAVERHVSGFQKHFSIGNSSSNILLPALSASHLSQQNDPTDSNLVQTHQQATEAFFDFSSQMSYIEEKIHFILPNLFISYLSLFETHFSRCLNDVTSYKSDFSEIKSAAEESNKSSKIQEKKFVSERKNLEEFIPKFWEYVISIENKSNNKEMKVGPVGYTTTIASSNESSTESYDDVAQTNNQTNDITYLTAITSRHSHSMQGFLWKKCHLNWKKRFFVCNNGLLSYGKTVESTLKSPKEIDLLLCAVKQEPNQQRKNCFSVRTQERKFVLQALTAFERDLWMSVIVKNIIAKATNNGEKKDDGKERQKPPISPSQKGKNRNADAAESHTNRKKHQNDEERSVTVCPSRNICADCGAKGASWVSVTWGVTLCTACAGVHRSLSSSVSFVRSIELDDIPPAQLMIVDTIGTKRANELLEGKLLAQAEREKAKKEQNEKVKKEQNEKVKKEQNEKVKKEQNEKENKEQNEKENKEQNEKEAKSDEEGDEYYEDDSASESAKKKKRRKRKEANDKRKKKKDDNDNDNDNDNNDNDDDDNYDFYKDDDDSTSGSNDIVKIQPDASSQKRTLFIQQKYKALSFVKLPKSRQVPNVFESIKNQSLIDVYYGLIFAKSRDEIPLIKGFTPLHASVCIGNPVILQFVLLQLPDFLNRLDDRGWSPLSYAAYYQSMPVVAFLLEQGADPDATPSSSHPLYIAKAKGNKDLELLIQSFSKDKGKIEMDNFKLPEEPPHGDFGNLKSQHESTLLMPIDEQKKLKRLDMLSGDEIRETFKKFRNSNLRQGKPSSFKNDEDS